MGYNLLFLFDRIYLRLYEIFNSIIHLKLLLPIAFLDNKKCNILSVFNLLRKQRLKP